VMAKKTNTLSDDPESGLELKRQIDLAMAHLSRQLNLFEESLKSDDLGSYDLRAEQCFDFGRICGAVELVKILVDRL
jgi:hypothetical protein